jgi:hypothetical protein
MWVDETMLVGRAIDVSEHGLCVITAPTDAIKRGDCYRVDVVVGADAAFSCRAEVRHVSGGLVGLQTVERLRLAQEPTDVSDRPARVSGT